MILSSSTSTSDFSESRNSPVARSIESITLDQIRVLIAVAETGSFSAAARHLHRVQSAVSTAVANMEERLGLTLFDRSSRTPRLRPEGQAILEAARSVMRETERLSSIATQMAGGLEAAVRLVVDALFPVKALVRACRDFAAAYPAVELRVETEVMSGVAEALRTRRSTLGISGPSGDFSALTRHQMPAIRMLAVASAKHILGRSSRTVSGEALREQVQIVLSERVEKGGPDQSVLSPRTYRVGDLHTKHQMITGALGWGHLPLHLIAGDLKRGRLKHIRSPALEPKGPLLQLWALHRTDQVLGAAHRWLLARLIEGCK